MMMDFLDFHIGWYSHPNVDWLVVEPYPSEKYESQLGL
jgi:hypothetical protein